MPVKWEENIRAYLNLLNEKTRRTLARGGGSVRPKNLLLL
jgi:hypothetical protein